MLCYYTAMSRLGLESFVLGEMDTNAIYSGVRYDGAGDRPADAGERLLKRFCPPFTCGCIDTWTF
jgi:hypothetical protein